MATSAENLKISDDTRVYIIDELIEPYYKNVVKNTLSARQCWRKTGIAFETISKIMVAFGSIISFSAGVYEDQTLSFVSGSISCLSLAFLQFSSFSYKENKKQSEELNVLLKKLGLETIPVLERSAVPQGKTSISQSQNQQTLQSQLPFQLPFDLSMFQQNKNEKDEKGESTLSTVKSLFESCTDTVNNVQSNIKDDIIELKEEVLDDINPLSNINVSLNVSSNNN